MTAKYTSAVDRVFAALASLRLTVAGLLLLLVLTIWGTLYQADNGLYAAQVRFYQSWFFMIGGFLPFPGAQSVMTLLVVNLLASMGRVAWKRKLHIGFFLTHTGLLLMLVAGAVTFYFGREMHLMLLEGEASNVAESEHDWELAIWRDEPGSSHDVSALDVDSLKAGDALTPPQGRMSLEVMEVEPNCDLANASGAEGFQSAPPDRDPDHNRPGLIVNVKSDAGSTERLVLWGGDERQVRQRVGDQDYIFSLRLKRNPLPATIELVDFKKVMHPGSGMAKSYSSQVVVRPAKGPERRVLISMNKPLRMSGFTFYQSSYVELDRGREASILAVVRNYGRIMPYVATGVTAAGMIIHFLGIMLARLHGMRAREARGA